MTTYTDDIITYTRTVPYCIREHNELSDITVIQIGLSGVNNTVLILNNLANDYVNTR